MSGTRRMLLLPVVAQKAVTLAVLPGQFLKGRAPCQGLNGRPGKTQDQEPLRAAFWGALCVFV